MKRNLVDYLHTVLAGRYPTVTLTDFAVLAVILDGLRGRDVRLANAPDWERYELGVWDKGIFVEPPVLDHVEVVTKLAVYNKRAMRAATAVLVGQAIALDTVLEIMEDNSDLADLAIVLRAETYLRRTVTEVEPLTYTEVESGPVIPHVDADSWLISGKFELGGRAYDLDAIDSKAVVPPQVVIAHTLRGAVDLATGRLDSDKLLAVAQVFAELSAAALKKQEAKPEERSLWPVDKAHWIYAMETAKPEPLLPYAEGEQGERFKEIVREHGRAAVRAASGFGSTRVFNLDGFVNSLVATMFAAEPVQALVPETPPKAVRTRAAKKQ